MWVLGRCRDDGRVTEYGSFGTVEGSVCVRRVSGVAKRVDIES